MDITALYKIFLECTSVTTDSRNCPEGSLDRKSTRLNSSHYQQSRMPSSA